MMNRLLATLIVASVAWIPNSLAQAQSIENCIKIEELQKKLVEPDFNSTELEIMSGCLLGDELISRSETYADNVSACFISFCVFNDNTKMCLPKAIYIKKYASFVSLKEQNRCP